MRKSFQELYVFAYFLPEIKELIQSMMTSKDLKLRYHGSMLYIVSKCGFRRGYVSQKTDGIITLRPRNYELSNNCAAIQFIGKYNVPNACKLCGNKRLNSILKQAMDAKLMKREGSIKLNRYLHKVHPLLKLKMFRTWLATTSYMKHVNELLPYLHTKFKGRRFLLSVQAINRAAKKIFNQPKNTYQYYVHPAIINQWVQQGRPFVKQGMYRGPGGKVFQPVTGLSTYDNILRSILLSHVQPKK